MKKALKKSHIEKIVLVILAVTVCAIYYFTSCSSQDSTVSKQLGNFDTEKGATKIGIVTSATKGLLSLQTDNGSLYTFSLNENTVFECTDETLGDTLSIEYEGEYEEFMVAKEVTVTKEAPAEDNTVIANTVSANTGNLFHIAGVTTDVTKNYITVASDIESEEQITINRNDSTIADENIAIGDSVGIYYVKLSENDLIATFIKVVSPKPEKVDASTNIHHITGTVQSSDDKIIKISKAGYEYTIVKGDNIISDDIAEGDTVRVYHTGSFTSGMTATYIEKIN